MLVWLGTRAGLWGSADSLQVVLSGIVGVRAELAAGDLRSTSPGSPAYGAWERDEDVFDRDADDDLEPPVPPGSLTAAQRALADFLCLDNDLLAIAAHTSPPLEEISDDPGDLADWVTRLPVTEKNQLLRIATRKPAEYDAAVTLLTDLQALAERQDRYDTFTVRTIELRQTHARKPTLIERLNRVGI